MLYEVWKNMADVKIVVDTREQHPLLKGKETIRKALKTGDYSLEGQEHLLSVERKSLPDLFGTLGSGHERFKKELARALNYKYFVILIEGSYSDCVNKNFPGSENCKMKGSTIISILFTIHLKYGVHLFFSSGRVEAKAVLRSI